MVYDDSTGTGTVGVLSSLHRRLAPDLTSAASTPPLGVRHTKRRGDGQRREVGKKAVH